MLDYFSMMAVNTAHFASLGFHEAASDVAEAVAGFGGVADSLSSGTAWSGVGLPQALAVSRTNRLAFDLANVQMQAGIAAMEGLATAIDNAQRRARDVLAEAHSEGRKAADSTPDVTFKGVDVSLDGKVSINLDSPYPLDHSQGAYVIAKASEGGRTKDMQATLAYAQAADITATMLLNRINGSRPVFTANAGAQAEEYNLAALGIATETNRMAAESVEVWQDTSPEEWASSDFSFGDVWDVFWDSMIPDPVALFQGDWSELLDVPVGPAILKIGKLSGKVDNFAGIANAYDESFDKAIRYVDLHEYLNALSPDQEGQPWPLNQIQSEENPDDVVLQTEVIENYYLDDSDPLRNVGISDLGEAARLQIGRGGDPIDGEDYVARAREVYARLDEWLAETEPRPEGYYPANLGDDDHPTYVSSEDHAIAERLHQRLQVILSSA